MNNAEQPAFPDNWDATRPGLTKREYFAAMAMQGLLSKDRLPTYDEVANYALAQADALLAELDK